MSIVLVRRNKLGRGSCNGIAAALIALGAQARVVRNWIPEELASITAEDLVVRWGCTSTLTRALEHAQRGTPPLNSAASIHWCSDKRAGRLAMQEADVPVPETWFAEAFRADFVRGLLITGQFVLRPPQHAQGRNLVSGAPSDIIRALNANALYANGYVSRLIPKVAEYRFFIMHGRVVWCARKTPGNPDDVAWNVARGGRFDNVRWDDWPLDAAKACIQAAIVSGTDFCGVDVMIDAEGRPYVLEVNSAPSQTSPYRQGCVARALKYVLENGRAIIPLPDTVKTYKGVRHPCLKEIA